MAEREEQGQEERQIVVFSLAGETCGMDISAVREIIRMPQVTRLPSAPRFVEGVANLRGNVIPILDLRKRLHQEAVAPDKETRVVVVDGGDGDIGVIVDAVTEVLRIPEDAVEGAGAGAEGREHVRGIVNMGERLIVLLDMTKVIAPRERDEALA